MDLAVFPSTLAAQQLVFTQKAVIQCLGNSCLVEALTNKNQFLAHITEGFHPLLFNRGEILFILRPVFLWNGFPEHTGKTIAGNATSLAPLPGKLWSSSPARSNLWSESACHIDLCYGETGGIFPGEKVDELIAKTANTVLFRFRYMLATHLF